MDGLAKNGLRLLVVGWAATLTVPGTDGKTAIEDSNYLGCFFDDEMHKILGLENIEWQSLYHFTVGKHLDDSRLETRAPYFHLDR
jgi:hypothetical protein